MDIVEEIDVRQASYWADFYESGVVYFAPPKDSVDVDGCQAVVTRTEEGEQAMRVPWKPDKNDLLKLMSGGTIWLSVWGGLPPHQLEVAPV